MTSSPAGQASLFEVLKAGPEPTPDTEPRAREETPLRPLGETDENLARLRSLVSRLGRQPAPLEAIALARQVRAVADTIVALAVQQARRGGSTWRQLGAELGVPFQTLFRRYGAADTPSAGPPVTRP